MFNSVIRSGVAGIGQAEVGDFRADSNRPTAVGRENPWAGASLLLPPIRLMTSPLGCNRWEPDQTFLLDPVCLSPSNPPHTAPSCPAPGHPAARLDHLDYLDQLLNKQKLCLPLPPSQCSYRPSLGHFSPTACAPSCMDTTCISCRIQRTSTRTTPIRNIHSSLQPRRRRC